MNKGLAVLLSIIIGIVVFSGSFLAMLLLRDGTGWFVVIVFPYERIISEYLMIDNRLFLAVGAVRFAVSTYWICMSSRRKLTCIVLGLCQFPAAGFAYYLMF